MAGGLPPRNAIKKWADFYETRAKSQTDFLGKMEDLQLADLAAPWCAELESYTSCKWYAQPSSNTMRKDFYINVFNQPK